MNPQEPVIPDPDVPEQDPGADVDDPASTDAPESYQLTRDGQYVDVTDE